MSDYQPTIPEHNKESKNDNWETPAWCWELISKYIPKDKVIWEPFYLNGVSGDILTNLGFNVIHKEEDFFIKNLNRGDIVVSNPPFTKNKHILKKLKDLDKPFFLLLPLPVISTMYFRKIFEKSVEDLTIFMFPKRVSFVDAKNVKASACYTTTFFLGYKVCDHSLVYL